jgi:hypothetical protein
MAKLFLRGVDSLNSRFPNFQCLMDISGQPWNYTNIGSYGLHFYLSVSNIGLGLKKNLQVLIPISRDMYFII